MTVLPQVDLRGMAEAFRRVAARDGDGYDDAVLSERGEAGERTEALNLAGGVLVVSDGVQIVLYDWISRTIWTIRNAMDVATVLPWRPGSTSRVPRKR